MIKLDPKWNPKYIEEIEESSNSNKTQVRLSDMNERFNGPFTCPITETDSNGRNKFVAIRNCGHVMSEKALQQIDIDYNSSERLCLVCQKSYLTEDVIFLNNINQSENSTKKRKLDFEEKATYNNQL